VVEAVFATAVAAILSRDRELARTGDPDDIHKSRVATRRLRAEIRLLRPVLVRSVADHLGEELKWLAGALGEVRDIDVRLEDLEPRVAALGPADVAGGRQLLAALLAERERANAHLLAMIESPRYGALLDDLVTAAADPPLLPGDWRAEAPARCVLPKLVGKRWARLRADVAQLDDNPSVEALHEIRKGAKKLRYAAELASPIVGKPAAKMAKAAEGLQGVLGEHHDASETEGWLRHHAILSGSPSLAVTAGELVAAERHRADRFRRQWPQKWHRLKKKTPRRWLKHAPVL
jgi:CHAD domain-containing protein